MISHQTQVNTLAVSAFLTTIKLSQKSDASTLIRIMSRISAEKPVMWGPSIVGFSTVHKVYGSGRQIDRPKLAFSPRKNALTIYFNEGFAAHADDLKKLGRYRHTVSCLYIQKIADIDLDVLTSMLKKRLKTYIKGKGTLRFELSQPLPTKLISQTVASLAAE